MNGLALSFRFEFGRTIRKPAFWLATLVLPAMVVVVGLLMTATPTASVSSPQSIPFTYSDPSGSVDQGVAERLGGRLASSGSERTQARASSTERAYLAFPASRDAPVEVYAPDRGVLDNGAYATLVNRLVRESALHSITDPSVRDAVVSEVSVQTHTTNDGVPTKTPGQIIPPMLFGAALFAIMLISGNRMLVSTLEEKENRVIEMILVGIRPLAFIGGKILALFALTGVQMAIILVPSLLFAGALRERPSLRFLSDVRLEFEAGPLLAASFLLVGALALFTGVLVAIGALSASAKDAGPYFGGFLILMVLPVYSITTLLADPSAALVQTMLYVPFTAPITALVLNAMGTLSGAQTIIAIIELLVVGAAAVAVAAHLFRRGALDAPSIRLPRVESGGSSSGRMKRGLALRR